MKVSYIIIMFNQIFYSLKITTKLASDTTKQAIPQILQGQGVKGQEGNKIPILRTTCQ